MRPILPLVACISILTSLTTTAQSNNVSSSPQPFCLGLSYTANASGGSAQTFEPANNYACLFTTPNPSWFFLKAGSPGDITLSLSAPQDIDYILYGPFSDISQMISNAGNLDAPYMVGCSYSSSNTETIFIPAMNTGDYYLLLVTNYASVVQDIDLIPTMGPGTLDCDVYTDAIYQTVMGHTFYDENQNGLFDGADYYISNVNVQVSPVGQTLTSNVNGDFVYSHMFPDSVFYSVSSSIPGWNNTTPNPYEFWLDTSNQISDTLLFGFYPDSIFYSGEVDLVNGTIFCAGSSIVWMNIINDGSLPASGYVQLNLDDNLLLVNSNVVPDSVVAGDYYFSYSNLGLFASTSIVLECVASGLLAGDTVENTATLFMIDSTLNIISVTDTATTGVACSYDPNNKIVLPNGSWTLNETILPDDKLEYIINFQNTGTAPAVNVMIKDSLCDQIDPSTFEFMSSSHVPYISISSNGIIEFNFENINLVDSLTDPILSQGYVKFRVALMDGVIPNEMVNNYAEIYFDMNAPIITNTTNNVLDCFIVPGNPDLYVANGYVQTDLSGLTNTFQWFFNGNILLGETTTAIEANLNGTYMLIATNQYDCSVMDSLVISGLGLNNSETFNAMIYPNPSANNFEIRLSKSGSYALELRDETGKLIFSDQISETSSYTLNGTTIQAGVYVVTLTNSDGIRSFHQVIKL